MSDYQNIKDLKLHGIMLIYQGSNGAVFVMRVIGGLLYSWDSHNVFVPTNNFTKPDSKF